MSPFGLEGNLPDICKGLPNVALIIIILGEGLWIITYALIIRCAYLNRTYGVPITAIALNFTWEIIYTLVCPSSCWVVRLLRFGWLALDLVIVLQLYGYGRNEQSRRDFQRYFFIWVSLIFVLAGIGHWTFRQAFQDEVGASAAYSINFVMSILFVSLFYERPHGRGLSYGAAWTKMLGTGILSIACAIGFISSPDPRQDFMLFLFATILLFDILYIILLHRARQTPLPA